MRVLAATALVAVAGLLASGGGCDASGTTTTVPPSEPEVGTATVRERGPLLGIAEPNAWRRVDPPASPKEIAALIDSIGAGAQRFVVDWSVVEPELPVAGHSYRFAPFDAMYRADLRRGIQPVLVVLNAPPWASDVGARPESFANPPAPDRIEDWKAFLATVVQRYPEAIAIEVWNEPNLAGFWGGGSPTVRPDAERYTALLDASYDAIKAADPRMVVVGGALASNQRGSLTGNVPAEEFARAMFGAGAAGHMDAISFHPYPGPGGVPRTLALVGQVREARDSVGATTPLWLTELGLTTTGPHPVSEAEQAQTLVEICQAVRREPDVDALFIHNLVEQSRAAGNAEAGFGLTQPLPGGTLRKKPAFTAVRRAFSARRRCGNPR